MKEHCKACYWKKQYSVFKWPSIASADFSWDKSYLVDKWWLVMETCKRCNGTGEELVCTKEESINVIDKIMEDYMETTWDDYSGSLRKILEKHLSSTIKVSELEKLIEKRKKEANSMNQEHHTELLYRYINDLTALLPNPKE